MTEEMADSVSLLAISVLEWGGGDRSAFRALVASGIDLAPPVVRVGFWRAWLAKAVWKGHSPKPKGWDSELEARGR